MKDTKFRILLDIHEVRSQATIPVKVGDVSCKIYITLVEGGKPYKIHENSFGVFTGKKGDDKYLFNNCVIENGIIRYDFTPQTVAAAGVLECEVRIYDEDGGVLTTPSFNIVVDERAVNDSELASTTEFTFLDEIIVNEGQRMENERNRIEAFNNMGLSVEDKGDYYILTKTNKDGSKEEFPIGKGEDYVITPEDYKAIADKVVTDTLDAQAAEYFDNLDAQATEHLENIDKNIDGIIDGKVSVVETATGKAITIESAKAPLPQMKLFGKTEQDGTPTPTEPKELKSVGDSGSFSVGVYSGNLLEPNVINLTQNGVTINISKTGVVTINGTCSTNTAISLGSIFYRGKYTVTPKWIGDKGETYANINPNGNKWEYVYGNPITFEKKTNETKNFSLVVVAGTYSNVTLELMVSLGAKSLPFEPCNKQTLTITDTLRGIGDIADVKDFARGVTTKRFNVVDLGTLTWGLVDGNRFRSEAIANLKKPNSKDEKVNALCSHYVVDTFYNVHAQVTDHTLAVPNDGTNINLIDKSYTDASALKTALSGVYLVYEYETPIETPISETELNAYRHLMTNKGNTTILSECEDTEITYYVNKPNAQAIGSLHEQINKDYLKLQQAIISTGGN